MERYYFHIRQGERLVVDDEGMLLKGLEAVLFEASESAKDLTRESLRTGKGLDDSVIEITDEAGHFLRFTEARRLLH